MSVRGNGVSRREKAKRWLVAAQDGVQAAALLALLIPAAALAQRNTGRQAPPPPHYSRPAGRPSPQGNETRPQTRPYQGGGNRDGAYQNRPPARAPQYQQPSRPMNNYYRQAPQYGRPAQSYPQGAPQYGRPAYAPPGARPNNPGMPYAQPALPGGNRPGYGYPAPPPGHLGSWLNQHRNMPVQNQEQLLHNDPSFNRLPAADQQRLMRQLQQVNRMPEEQRERRLARAEAIEHMSPQERMQLHNSTRQLAALPPDRQAMVKHAFQDLRGVPLDQRQTVLDSSRYQSQFSPEERGILSNLLKAEPYEAQR